MSQPSRTASHAWLNAEWMVLRGLDHLDRIQVGSRCALLDRPPAKLDQVADSKMPIITKGESAK